MRTAVALNSLLLMARGRAVFAAVLVALLGSTCEAPSQRPAIAQPASPPRARELDPATVAVEPESPLGRARAALAGGDAVEAQRIAEEALRDSASLPEAGRLRWMAAEAASARGDEGREAARRHRERLAGVQHPLSRWARLRLATMLADEAPEQAVRLVEPLREGWAGGYEARLLHALGLARAGREEEAVPALRALVEATPDHVGAATPGMPLAEILARSDDPAEREEALVLYRRVATRAPLARVGREAAQLAEAVLASLPEARRAALAQVPVEDRFAQAEAFYNSMHHERAETDFAALVADLPPDHSQLCSARLLQGKAMIRRRERDRGAEHMERVASDCTDTDIRAWARYYAAKAHAQRSRHDQAMAQYALLEEEAPEHRLADDARYRSALSALEKGDEEDMRERLRSLPERYPQGDMRGTARFLLAWRARSAGDLEGALTELEASLAEGPGEDAEDVRGRAAYWRARTLADLDRREEAIEAYLAVARSHPLSYYAQQALARLEAVAPERAEAVRASWRTEGDPEPLTFPWRREFEAPEMETAIELLRVGDIELAEEELEEMGALGEGADPDMLWAVAALLHRAGAHPEASLLVRRRVPSFLQTAPTGRAYRMWRVAYPRAFSPLIEDVARREGVPAAFVRAVAREESAFNPKAVSIARAYGLIQLIEPTARRFARELDLPADPVSLRDPTINVPIGTRFIAFLWQRYQSNPAIVPSAYNAGEGAADRWLRQRPDQPLDVWIENIPYDETRRYTRRVLQTYGIYSWLDGQELPALVTALPSRG